MLTQERVKELFDYKDGQLIRKVTINNNKAKKGHIVERKHNGGYLCVSIDGITYLVHRVVFLWHHGYIPEFIDHKDGSRSNNKINNLRECTASQNQRNSKIGKNNTSGVKGDSWDKINNKWVVRITVGGKYKNFGRHDDLELAQLIADHARDKYHQEFARNA